MAKRAGAKAVVVVVGPCVAARRATTPARMEAELEVIMVGLLLDAIAFSVYELSLLCSPVLLVRFVRSFVLLVAVAVTTAAVALVNVVPAAVVQLCVNLLRP